MWLEAVALEETLKEMDTPYRNVEEFVAGQVREALEKYEQWKKAEDREK